MSKIILNRSFHFIIVASILMACRNCPDKTCPQIDTKYNEWFTSNSLFNKQFGDTVTYQNSDSLKVQFYKANAGWGLLSGLTLGGNCSPQGFTCGCYPCEVREGSFIYNSVDKKSQMIYQIRPNIENNPIYVEFDYSIFNYGNKFLIGPQFKLINNNDSIIQNFLFRGNTYTNVFVHQIDTNNVPVNNDQFYVWKTYFSKEQGIFAFYDLKSHSMFYKL